MKIDTKSSYKFSRILTYLALVAAVGLYIIDPLEKSIKFSVYLILLINIIAITGLKNSSIFYVLHCVFLVVLISYYFIA